MKSLPHKLAIPLLALAAPLGAFGQTIFFNGPNEGAWSNAVNWNGGVRPGASQIAGINGNSGGTGSGGVIVIDSLADIGSVAFSGSVAKTIRIDGSGVIALHGTGSSTVTLLTNTGNQTLTIRDGEVRLLQSGIFNVTNTTRSLSIASTITEQGGSRQIVKTGAGSLQLSNAAAAASTFSGGLHLTEGSLVTNVSSSGTANVPTSGPFGTGTLTVENGTTLRYSGTSAPGLLHNRVAIRGDIAIGDNTQSQRWVFAGDIDLEGGVRKITIGQNVTFSGALQNGGLTKAGSSTLTLTGENLHTGVTSVEQGTLALSDNGSIAASERIEIAAEARLDIFNQYAFVEGQTVAARGVIGGAMRLQGASVEIGSAEEIGTLEVDGDALFAEGAFQFKLSASDHDRLVFTGDGSTIRGNTTGAIRIALSGFEDFDGTAGTGEFLLISTAGATGSIFEEWDLSAFTLETLPIGWNGVLRMENNDLYFAFQPVPEGRTWALLAAGGLFLGAASRRRIKGEPA